jgi:alkaline phosphatase
VVQDFASQRGDTLVIITADHECAGVALIGGSRVTDSRLQELVREGGEASLRDKVVGIYEQAGFPKYRLAGDGYPQTTDIDYRLLVAYGANSDRFEDWRTNDRPLQDSQQPFVRSAPLSAYPAGPSTRDMVGSWQINGQVPGDSAVHTASDIPLSAFGPGAYAFTGVIDNTDVFFRLAQASVKGVLPPPGMVVRPTVSTPAQR